MENKPTFEVIVLGILFDPLKKKILIGKRKESEDPNGLGWTFPGARLMQGEDLDKALKRIMTDSTGYKVKNIGTFFSRTYEEEPNVVSISFLTRAFEGEDKPGRDFEELKWVSVQEIEDYFTIPMHKKLKKFLRELV
jgi:ADP-ribose pyrophosphatase YjhB (NUDIX family)